MRIQKPTITQITQIKGDNAELTGSFKGTFQDNIISGAAQIADLAAGIVSGSSQIGDDISGSLSITHVNTKVPGLISGSAQLADDISGSLSTAHVNTKVPGLVSGSAQIADNISGSLSVAHVNTKVPGLLSGSAQIAANISGSFTDASASIATDIDALQGTDISITLTGDVTGTGTITDLGNVSFATTVTDDSHNHIVGNVDGLQDALDLKAPLASPALTGTPTAPTATTVTNSTQVATTAFVQSRVQEVIDAAPAALDTLNELAAAINDDANFAGTVTTSLGEKLVKSSNLSDLTDASAARTNLGLGTAATTAATDYATAAQGTTADNALPKAGGQMTGNITFSGAQTVDGRDLSADGAKLDGIESGATADQTAAEIRALVESATDSNVFTDADHSKLDGIAASANNYTHPTHPGDDFSVDSGALTGATVISDIDINVTTDTLGHVTDANGTIATRTLTLADLGYSGTTNANTYAITQDNTSNVHFEGLMVGQTTGATANTIRCVGDVVAYYSSDAQFKDNVETLEGALDKVKAIRGVRFDWNDKQDVYEGHDIGVIAQEVQAVYPELVHHRDHSDSLAVDYVKLTAVLIEAVKELSAKVDELSK